MNVKQLYLEAMKRQDVKTIVKYKWDYDLSAMQQEIVRKIAFLQSRRLSISAMTRYGKTRCVSIGLALVIDFGIPYKIAFLGPKQEQAGIIRQYMSELITSDRQGSLLAKAQITATAEERLNTEASRKRMTFKTGAEYRVFSGEGDADRLMGFGCDILVRDEACLLSSTAYTKSSRMLGDNPENSIIIELYNPWDRDNKAYQHVIGGEWETIQVGWETAVKEGRTTEQYVEEQRKELTALEFDVLYNSKFPDESEDSIFSLKDIRNAEERTYTFEEDLQSIERLLEHKNKLKESKYRELQEEVKKYTRIIACDPADKGKDQTVIWWGTKYENKYQLVGSYSENKSDQMEIVGKIIKTAEEFIGTKVKGIIGYDRVGIGTGALSRTKEVVKEKGYKNISVQGYHFGEASTKKDLFQNKKAENYFRLQSLFREGMISIPKDTGKLKTQLMAMKWSLTSSSKRKIEDPDDYSPDWADALVYLCWQDNVALSFAFV
jgi:hypothetical protein